MEKEKLCGCGMTFLQRGNRQYRCASCQRDENIQRSARRHQKYRQKIIDFLGGKCANTLCGFSDVRALQIDHVFGDGAQETSSADGLHRYYKKYFELIQLQPERYQCLCANCNWIKRAINQECRVMPLSSCTS